MLFSTLFRIMIELSLELDSYKDKGARRRLVEELQQKGIVDKQVIRALNAVPRHLFIHKDFRSHAYLDKAFPIGDGQTISQPYTVAYQTQMLHIQKGEKVLEIGTGSGYQAAILSEIGAELTSIERHKGLHESAKAMLAQLELKANLLLGDGTSDISKPFGPYNKIIVTAGAPKVPMSLASQLAIGGTMIIPIGDEKEQMMHSLIKKPNGEFEVIPLTKFRFVPLIGEQAW